MRKILLGLLLAMSVISAEGNIKIISQDSNGIYSKIECIDSQLRGVPKASVDNNKSQLSLKVSGQTTTVIHIMVDTSRSMGNSYRRGIQPFLKAIIPKLEKEHITISLSIFSKNMTSVYNTGDNNLTRVLKKIHIKGRTTELYRNTRDALALLSKQTYDRKILMLLSDGDAEDTLAYTSGDVIKDAKRYKIRIATLGYKERETKLQNLRKISEDTYGKLWIADRKTHKMTSKFYEEFAKMIQSQFTIQIPKSLLYPTKTGSQTIDIKLTQGKDIEILPVELATEKLVIEKPTFWMLYKLYIFIGLAVLLLLLLLLLLRPKREELVIEEERPMDIMIPEPVIVEPEPEPVAFLEPMGGIRHPIYKFPATIGKRSTNDVVIDGKYISRNHAVIDFKDGTFSITDRDSANKTKVNGQEITGTITIVPEDKIEFGPYKTVFILN